eukprot:1097597-Rhodomonas_salina.1
MPCSPHPNTLADMLNPTPMASIRCCIVASAPERCSPTPPEPYTHPTPERSKTTPEKNPQPCALNPRNKIPRLHARAAFAGCGGVLGRRREGRRAHGIIGAARMPLALARGHRCGAFGDERCSARAGAWEHDNMTMFKKLRHRLANPHLFFPCAPAGHGKYVKGKDVWKLELQLSLNDQLWRACKAGDVPEVRARAALLLRADSVRGKCVESEGFGRLCGSVRCAEGATRVLREKAAGPFLLGVD